MTIVEKKKIIKQIIDELPESNLDEVLNVLRDLASKDESRKEILLELLKNEKCLFEKLAK